MPTVDLVQLAEAEGLRPRDSNAGISISLPSNWRLPRLRELMEFRNGVNADAKAYGRGIPFISVLEVVTQSRLTAEAIPGLVSIPSISVRAYSVRRGDLVFNRTSEMVETVGLAAVYDDDAPVVFGGFVIRGRITDPGLDPIYASYALRSSQVRAQIIARAQGAIYSNIGQVDLGQVSVPIPPLPEQRAIAAVLRDIDSYLNALERLIAKKRDIKLGTVQQLTTGRTRLPGFRGPWVEVSLKELADIRGGGTPRTDQPNLWDGDILWCTPTDITALQGRKYLTDTNRKISAQGLSLSSAELLRAQSVLMTSRATIGECAICTVPVATNQGFKNFVPSRCDPEFLFYLLASKKQDFVNLCAGSTFLEIGKKQLANFVVRVPDKEEQGAIASALSDIDVEIDALQSLLTKGRHVKQAVMQGLVSGQLRLPQGEARE